MTKNMKDRLAAIEEAQQDGQGAFLFVTEQADGLFRDAHTNRTYTAERLQALHDARPDLVIFNQGGADSVGPPPHPAGNPQGLTLNDIRLYNEIVSKRLDGELLTEDEEAVLAKWESQRAEAHEAYEEWEEASRPQFEETVRRVGRLNARTRR